MHDYLPTAMNEFLDWKAALQKTVSFELAFVDMCHGDHIAAIVLAQVVSELALAREGKRPWVLDNDEVWMPLPYAEWYQATRVRRRQAQRVLKKLNVQFRYLDTAVKQVSHGVTASHVHLREHRFMEVWTGVLEGKVPDPETQDLDL